MRRALLIALLGLVAVPAAAPAQLTETRRTMLSPRLMEVGFTTPSMPAETNVRILLPAGYAAQPARRYPVLYLLHGCCDFDVDGSQAWTTHGEAEAATQDLPLIVVMPAGGRGGMYSDWRFPGAQGQPQYQAYHLGELVPWVDRELRTIAAREGRALAGLSMGGFGAFKYAAEHPDRFVAAASFSGAVDSNTDGGVIHAALPAFDGGTPLSAWGGDDLRRRGQNPWDLAENLRGLWLVLRAGNGQPGPYDDPGGRQDPVEAATYRNSVSLHERLAELGLPHVWDDYGAGTHTWPYWARGLRQTLPDLMALFAAPPAPPARVTFRSVRPDYEVYGWRVRWAREGLAWSRLVDAGRDGFAIEGDGRVEVRTPAGHTFTLDVAGRETVAIPPPAPRSCAATLRAPRRLRGVRATAGGRRVPVRRGRVRVTRGERPLRVVFTGRDRRGRRHRVVRTVTPCPR